MSLNLNYNRSFYSDGNLEPNKSISFLVLPIYTRIFSLEEYGSIEMMAVIVSLLIAILIMGTDSAQSFFFAEQKKGGKNKQKILIHCICGVSRSVTILLAYIIKKYNYTPQYALKLVKKKRNIANPNSNFMKQLWTYYENNNK